MNLPLSANSIYSQIFFMVPPAAFPRDPLAALGGPRPVAALKSDYYDDVDKALGIPSMTLADGVAVIPVRGVLAQGVSRVDRWYGFWGYEQIDADLTAAEANPKCQAIVLNIDSPGGQASGALESATRIAECSKPVIAYTGGLMASAAYYLARGASGILCAPSAIVGSIGTYMTIYDFSKYCADLGIEVTVLKSGDHKGAGVMGTSLTPDQEAALQAIVDVLGGQFRAYVKAQAPEIPDAAMQGQAFVGTGTPEEPGALELQLVNGCGTLADASACALALAVETEN